MLYKIIQELNKFVGSKISALDSVKSLTRIMEREIKAKVIGRYYEEKHWLHLENLVIHAFFDFDKAKWFLPRERKGTNSFKIVIMKSGPAATDERIYCYMLVASFEDKHRVQNARSHERRSSNSFKLR